MSSVTMTGWRYCFITDTGLLMPNLAPDVTKNNGILLAFAMHKNTKQMVIFGKLFTLAKNCESRLD